MKFGVKTYFNKEFADYFKDKADFLEVMAVPGKDYSFLENYPLPVVVHAMHSGFGINNADEKLVEKNLEAIYFAVELADKCGAEKIVVHPGLLKNENCFFEWAVDFLEGLDKRIIVENLTARVGGGICSTPNEMKKFVEMTGRKICFDVNHAIEVADSDGVDYFDYIRKFVAMKPVHYHIGGQMVGEVKKDHLSFESSNIPAEKIIGILPDDAWVSLETSVNIESVERDLEFVRSVVNDIRN